MKTDFLLDPNVIFLNHGSFGACPAPVFEVYQCWQRRLERQPVQFLGRDYDALMHTARQSVAAYVHTAVDNLIFVPNATTGINTVARSLQLNPGDEVLATNHEYGAIDHTWSDVCARTGAVYKQQSIPLPYDPAAFVEYLWQGVTARTRVIAISHMTSATALIFPVAEVCRRARSQGILTVIDGAHVPGHRPLDLDAIGVDFYAGNLHKWLCAPKGSGFLYVRPEHHEMVRPLVTSWGHEEATFAARHQWQGTRDIAAFLSVPDAIQYQAERDWETVRDRCHALAVMTRDAINALTGLEPICPPSAFRQMFTVKLPVADAFAFTAVLYKQFNVEVPAIAWEGGQYIRVSIQGYNTLADVDRLIEAIRLLLE
jgi:isopenicillin-N epimerase